MRNFVLGLLCFAFLTVDVWLFVSLPTKAPDFAHAVVFTVGTSAILLVALACFAAAVNY